MKHLINSRIKTLALIIALFFFLFVGMESLALARAGGGRSSGSRGFSSGSSSSSGGTYRSTPSTPYQRPMTSTPMAPVQRPGLGRTFMAGLGGGLVGGMLGSMLFRGPGYAGGGGGWGGGGGYGGMGLILDFLFLAIIVAIIYFVVKRFRARRQEMAYSSTAAYSPVGYDMPPQDPYYAPSPPVQNTVYDGIRHIADMDPSFDEMRFKETVEDYFFKIQGAWTRRDLGPIKYLLTPQMLNTFQEDVSRYIANKQFNRLENIAVRQVDIVDAVQDQGEEYITVKFLANLLDYVTDETGGVISGSTSDPVKFLEYWTWTRRIGERNWVLAGITQERDY
jgi:predicted lipid-binding transport protein (Tim44 family)